MPTFSVSTLADSGLNSLRQAILDANAVTGVDTIVFDADLSGTIGLTSGELLITDSLNIVGPGANLLSIDAQQNSRVFHIFEGRVSDSLGVNISGLTITGGRAASPGGGIRSFGDLTVTDSIISGNSGGGIYNRFGDLTISNSTISNNTVNGKGGGLYSSNNTLEISNSTISGNAATGKGAGGGGVYTSFSNATLINTTVSGNSASGDDADGGGIFSVFNQLNINNSTVSNNKTTGENAGGGGIFYGIGNLKLNSSIVADNTVNDVESDIELLEATSSGNNNLIGVADGTGFISGVNDNQVGFSDSPLDPLLGPLQDNGGFTFTQLPLPGSPAVAAGINPLGLLTDQRGETRSVGRIDIGAAEVQTTSEPTTTVPEPTSVVSLVLIGAVLGRKWRNRR